MDSVAPPPLVGTCAPQATALENTDADGMIDQAMLGPPTTPQLTLHEYRRQQHSPTPSFWSDSNSRRVRRKPSLADLSARRPSDLFATHGPRTSSDGAQVAHLYFPLPRRPPSQILYKPAHAPSLTSTIDTLPSTATSPSADRDISQLSALWAIEASAPPVRTKRRFDSVNFAKRLPSRPSDGYLKDAQGPWRVHAAIVDLNQQAERAASPVARAPTTPSLAVYQQPDQHHLKSGILPESGIASLRKSYSTPFDRGTLATTESSFTLSKYQFPTPPVVLQSTTFERLAEQTLPSSPTTIHLKEASFELVNPHDSLLLGHHELETPAEIDGLLDDYFNASTSEHDMASSSSLTSDDTKRGRQLFQDLASAHRNITGSGPEPAIEQHLTDDPNPVADDEHAVLRKVKNEDLAGKPFRPASSVYPGSLRSNPFDLELSEDRNEQPNIDGVVAVGERDGVVVNAISPLQDDDVTYGSIIADYEYTRDPFGDDEGRPDEYSPSQSPPIASMPPAHFMVPPQDCRDIGLVADQCAEEALTSQTYGSTRRLLNITPKQTAVADSPSPTNTEIVAKVSPDATWRSRGMSYAGDEMNDDGDSIANTSVYSQDFALPELRNRTGDVGRTLGMFPFRSHDEPFERAVSVMERGLRNAHLSSDELGPEAPTLEEMQFLGGLQASDPDAHARALEYVCKRSDQKHQSLNSFDHVIKMANDAGDMVEMANEATRSKGKVRMQDKDAAPEAGWPSRVRSILSFSKTPKPSRPSIYTPHRSFVRALDLYEGERSASQATECRGLLGVSPSPYGDHSTLEYCESRGTFQTLPNERPQTPLNFDASSVSPPPAAFTSLGRIRNSHNHNHTFEHGDFDDVLLTPDLPESASVFSNMHEGPVQPIIEGVYYPRPTLRFDRPARPARPARPDRPALSGQIRPFDLELGDANSRNSRAHGAVSEGHLINAERHWTMTPNYAVGGSLHEAHLRGFNVYPTSNERLLMRTRREQNNPENLEWRRVSTRYLIICCMCPITALMYGTGHMDKFLEKKTEGRFAHMHKDSKRLALIFGVPMSILFYAVIGVAFAFAITVAVKGGTDWN